MQVLHFAGPFFQQSVQSPPSDQFSIGASGPTLDPPLAAVTMMVGMLGGLLFATGLVAFAIRLRREHVGTSQLIPVNRLWLPDRPGAGRLIQTLGFQVELYANSYVRLVVFLTRRRGSR